MKTILQIVVGVVVTLAGLHRAAVAEHAATMPALHREFFQAHCVRCHGPKKQEGRVRLDDLSATIRDLPTAERWQKVLNALNSGEMPPENEPQPADADKAKFLEALSRTMVEARRLLSDAGGVITMRRLNKREYELTIRDLLGVKINAKDLPNDGGGTFDTVGKSLFFSSDQFEQYLAIARKALDAAIVDDPRPKTETVRTEAETESNHRITSILRGYQMNGYRAYMQWKASNGRPPSDFGIVDEGEMNFRKRVWDLNTPPMIDYLTRPETQTGALLTIGEPNPQVGLLIPDAMPAGRYRIRARIGLAGKGKPAPTFVEIGFRGKSFDDAINLIECRQVTEPAAKCEIIETEIDLPPLSVPLSEEIGPETKKRIPIGERVIAFRERQHNSREAGSFRHRRTLGETGFGIEPRLWIDWVEWEGPIVDEWPTAAQRQIFFGDVGDESDSYARAILERFATRAFRGKPVKPSYLDRLTAHYRTQRDRGANFVEALKEPLSIVLASPSFLYLTEPSERPTGQKTLTDIELANRLSYLLTSRPPDDALLEAAKSGDLTQPATLHAQVDRLLESPSSWNLITGFAHQWLGLDRLEFFQFNYRLYPEFDDSVKGAARDEVFHTLHTMLREDLPLVTLLESDFVVVNDLLADYYGLPKVRGSQFRKVKVADDVPRGGFLGMAAVLAMGSDGERSSPVERGAWVLRKLLNDPPPPAPANVPQLSRHAGKLLSARELLTAHMEEPQCSQCHRRIDPIGFGLEHFDAAGRWREKEYTENASGNIVRKSKEHPIDDTGTLPDGTEFEGFFELRRAVARHDRAFARGLTENLIAYGLGRAYGFCDEALCEAVLTKAESSRFSLRALIHALVDSREFQSK